MCRERKELIGLYIRILPFVVGRAHEPSAWMNLLGFPNVTFENTNTLHLRELSWAFEAGL